MLPFLVGRFLGMSIRRMLSRYVFVFVVISQDLDPHDGYVEYRIGAGLFYEKGSYLYPRFLLVHTLIIILLYYSTLLKSDQWTRESHSIDIDNDIRGAINFRGTPNTNIYALGQPTTEAIDQVVRRVKLDHPLAQRIVWITLREEPIVYVNGAPYCLRREGFSLRNMKDYGGISAGRLEVLEERLRDDVREELKTFGGQ